MSVECKPVKSQVERVTVGAAAAAVHCSGAVGPRVTTFRKTEFSFCAQKQKAIYQSDASEEQRSFSSHFQQVSAQQRREPRETGEVSSLLVFGHPFDAHLLASL